MPEDDPTQPVVVTPSARPEAGLGSALVKGAMWSVALRWALRFIGLVTTLIVARILAPSDYGLIAMAGLVAALVETFVDVDATTALLRHPKADRDFIDSAWTLKVIQAVSVAALVAVAAPFAALYFKEPRVGPILLIYALSALIGGFGSVGHILARKDYDFGLEVKQSVIGKVSAFVVTVTLALLFRNYWALALGQLIGSCIGFVIGYAMHPFRPRFTFIRIREIFGFSQWLLISGMGVFFARKVDGFILGRIGTSAQYGLYNVASELGQMLPAELGAPLSRALLPILSTLHDEPVRMREAVMRTTGAVNTLTLPVGVGLALVAPLVVSAVLGPKWTDAAPFLMIFSIIGAIRYLTGPYYALFMSLGHSRFLAMMSWIELIVFAVLAVALWHYAIMGVVLARVGSTIVIVMTWMVAGHREGLGIRAFGRTLLRPGLATIAMAAAVLLLLTVDAPDLARLVLSVIAGGIAYATVLYLLWRKAGRPDGLEARIVGMLVALRLRRQPRPVVDRPR